MKDNNLKRLFSIGDSYANFRVYIGNTPNYEWKCPTKGVLPLNKGEIKQIGDQCGNGWRKVFNVYAKLLFALGTGYIPTIEKHSSWQQFRDEVLLQANSDTLLSFHQTNEFWKINGTTESAIHLIMGKTYANSLNLPDSLQWVNHEFALDKGHRILVCPYFDYRQLSNQKIIHLVELIQYNFPAFAKTRAAT